MLQHNLHSSLTRSNLCIFILTILTVLSEKCYGAHFQYESCVPRNCNSGPNISYPFYITGLQQSYCGYPGFGLDCTQDGLPALRLPENDYVVNDIFYHNRSLRVYDAAVSGITIYDVNGSSRVIGNFPSEDGGCLPIIRNTSLPTPQFYFASLITRLHIIRNCTASLSNLTRLGSTVICNTTGPRPLAIFGDQGDDLRDALENCATHFVAPVEDSGNIMVALRTGFALNWTAADSGCSACESSGGRCGFDNVTNSFRCFCPDRPRLQICVPVVRKKNIILPLVTGLGAALAITAFLVALILIRKRRTEKAQNQKDIELFLKKHENLSPKRFEYKKLKKITNSFSEKLGKGGYGSVYKGKLEDGRLVAVKILNESKGNGEEFMNEVASISRTSHVNIVSLLGFCFDGSKRALIYEYMPNGSLEKFIHQTASSSEDDKIGWEKLFEIAVGIARGLDYLHQGCNTRILHLDIKPHNILLDDDLKPKIADFGLAKLCPNRASIVSMVVARGTIGYIAPEVFCRNFGDVSYKSDVYSYGMMVLEMVGKRNDDQGVDGTTEVYFPENIYRDLEIDVENGGLEGNVNEDESQYAKRKLTIVGLWCIQTDPKDRPSMSRVVEMLEGKLESLQVPPKPQSSSIEASELAQNVSTTGSIYSY